MGCHFRISPKCNSCKHTCGTREATQRKQQTPAPCSNHTSTECLETCFFWLCGMSESKRIHQHGSFFFMPQRTRTLARKKERGNNCNCVARFGGFGHYFVPVFQGSPEVVYPRVNSFSITILLLSYLFLILSLISEFGGDTGWTLYPPLSTSFMTLSPSSTGHLILGLLISGISSCLTSLNFGQQF